ncbi:hypothetical protein C8T65DRAFT_741706 [Cerioporus squamosus]|nr:hypothetical protein C8T65DRAFT_741706 [Cerioporus squamosus]
MHSPGRISPTLSESSSDSPDNEIEEYTRIAEEPTPFVSQGPSSGGFISGFGAPPKRRLPGGLVVGGVGARDPKSRKKDVRGGGGGMWDQGGAGSSRGQRGDDLVDQHIVDQLRIQFGDPFDETPLKNASAGN